MKNIIEKLGSLASNSDVVTSTITSIVDAEGSNEPIAANIVYQLSTDITTSIGIIDNKLEQILS